MKCIAKIIVSVIIGSIIIATPVWATSESENNIYYTADESAMESQQSDIIPRGEVSGKKYSFAYEFKHYARLVMNAALDKANLTVHLSVTNWAGEDKIYFSAYKDGMFGGAKKAKLNLKKVKIIQK